MGVDHSKFLLARVQYVAPGYYTEKDGGDWYIVTPDHSGRVGEGFKSRDDARHCLAWLAGDTMPKHWRIAPFTDDATAIDLDCGQGYPATVWVAEARKVLAVRMAQPGVGGGRNVPNLPKGIQS